jgi:hemolysin III
LGRLKFGLLTKGGIRIYFFGIYQPMPYQMLKNQFQKLSIEEVANTLTHGFGLVLSVAGLVILVMLASIYGDILHIVSAIIYGLSLIVLYAASTFYHGATSPKAKENLQLLDHCCIYLLIAGSYTPFTLIALRGTFGYSLLAFVWLFALIGIVLKVFFHKKFPAASVISYVVMGWIGLIAVYPLFLALGMMPIALIVAGGLIYSIGVIFYSWKSLKHHHAVWHLFVLGGSILHFLAISIYVLPYAVNLYPKP